MQRLDVHVLLLEHADYRVMPWQNGGGITREIFVHGRTDTGFDWRLSIAEVAGDGPFSSFAGYARTILLLDGRGMRLRFGDAGEVRVTDRFRPVDFDGGADTFCTLIDGPVRDFNIISARARVRHEQAIVSRFPKRSDASGVLAIHCLAGSLTVMLDDGRRVAVERGASLLQLDAQRGVREIDGAADSHALLVRFHRTG